MTVLRRPRHPHYRRHHKQQIRLTSDEYSVLEDAAREQQLAMGAFIREAAIAFTVGERLRNGDDAISRRIARLARDAIGDSSASV